MDIRKILQIMPHRYPFLLIDRIVEYRPFERIAALKNVTINEPFFQGHFPHRPIMPGVLIVEAMAQATGMLAFYSDGMEDRDRTYYLVGVDRARFKKPVEPGDQLLVSAQLRRQIRGIYQFDATASVGDTVVCTAQLMTTEMSQRQ
ncbi:MAG: 3-hydroxyacyl-ACP dehydratase FabZ [Gammaproteobacteria bacterium]|nr:3-hydroxyacyl-ACP dehydratase FabZ [Gammaproteobacteria bacterium]